MPARKDIRPSREQLRLIIENRKRVQEVALELLLLIRAYEQKIASDLLRRRMVMICVGATFALWRAVPLVYVNREIGEVVATSGDYLEQIVRHNAINYSDDDRSRGWSFGYYLSDARYRLREFCLPTICDTWPDGKIALEARGLLGQVTEIRQPGYDTMENVSKYIDALQTLVEALKPYISS